jgi:hypothetical protein
MLLRTGGLMGESVFPYWVLFALFALPALNERLRRPDDVRTGPTLWLLGIFTALMVGLRFQVGADFEQYQFIFERASGRSFLEALKHGDPAYEALNWIVGASGGGVWQVNLVCASIFIWGLVKFCRREPAPLLAALVAIPYLVVVVGMGYTRQAVAIGVILAGLASLRQNRNVLRFAVYVAVAALFHRTAVLVLPLAIFAGQRNHFLNALAIIAIAYGLYDALLAHSVDELVENYIDARYSSQGAGIRVAMNVLPALLVLFVGRRLGLDDYERRLWSMIAIVSLAMVPALAIVPSTTAIDRISLYLIPIQMIGLGRSIFLFRSAAIGRMVIVTYCFAVLFVWLNFAAHAQAWIPYRLTPIWS